MDSSSNYMHRLNSTLDYIEQNLDASLTLDELASVAHFSRFHFNRIFHAMLGETPFGFIARLRVERAAVLLLSANQLSVSEVAVRCGFSDLAVFSRTFKQFYGMSPSVFRKEDGVNSKIGQIQSNKQQLIQSANQHLCKTLQKQKMKTKMEQVKAIAVKTLPTTTVAYIRSFGPYEGNSELYRQHRERLFLWAGAQGLMESPFFQYLILYHDNPEVALTGNLRMSLCVGVPPATKVSGEIGKMQVEGGQYAVCRFEMTASDFPRAWEWLYGHWLPNSGYQPDDKPYFETYPEEPKGELFLVDFCIPVKAL
jgi:AraC family transcriptional regulator